MERHCCETDKTGGRDFGAADASFPLGYCPGAHFGDPGRGVALEIVLLRLTLELTDLVVRIRWWLGGSCGVSGARPFRPRLQSHRSCPTLEASIWTSADMPLPARFCTVSSLPAPPKQVVGRHVPTLSVGRQFRPGRVHRRLCRCRKVPRACSGGWRSACRESPAV